MWPETQMKRSTSKNLQRHTKTQKIDSKGDYKKEKDKEKKNVKSE